MSQTYINQGFEKDLEYGTKGSNENDVKIR
jgi:hypothetical protein